MSVVFEVVLAVCDRLFEHIGNILSFVARGERTSLNVGVGKRGTRGSRAARNHTAIQYHESSRSDPMDWLCNSAI